MSEIHGHVTSVAREVRGDELTAAASLGATVLSVGDTADFNDEQAGSVLINGETYGYSETGVDHAAKTLTLTSGLLAAAAVGDRVECYNPITNDVVAEWVATVTDDLDDTPLEIPIAHTMVDKLDQADIGVRSLATESVVARRDSAGRFEVTDLLGKTPEVNREYVTDGPEAWGFRTRSTNQSIPDATWTVVEWPSAGDSLNSAYFGTGQWSAGTDTLGNWMVSASVTFASNTTGRRGLRIKVGDFSGTSESVGVVELPPTGGDTSVSLTCLLRVTSSAADDFWVEAFQNSGGPLNITSGRVAVRFLG